ncbi:hypothetical protein OCU04_001921 [Sclerotinia nivalis]|uniref:Uncharacterized protein n=1 Tax=Sclerotinia nivalis TaxID=352851 RepID=A0A9X0DS28_9HELO|nr:hypothetical protein OCU04_001921 [Sclerotinia nivalis]
MVQSQRPFNNNNERPPVPLLELQMTYKIWSDNLNSDMQGFFEVTDTETPSVKGNKIVAPPLTDLIISLTRIASAIDIMSDRNSVSMRDESVAFLVPKLRTLQLSASDLQKLYELYRIRWAEMLTEMAIECQNVAGRVSRLEQEWELILDEVVSSDNEGKGDGVPPPGSVLSKDCDDEYELSRFHFGKAKRKSKHCTFEELAFMIYHQILAEHRDHAIFQKRISMSRRKGSKEIITLLSDIKMKVRVLELVAKAAEEEKTGVLNDRNETWISERKNIWNYLGWGSWGALYSEEENEARSKEADIINSLAKDVTNLEDLGTFAEDVRNMVMSDTGMWGLILDHSEKFLNMQNMPRDEGGDGTGRIFGGGVKAEEKGEPDGVWMNWLGVGEWKAKKGDKKSNTESKGQGSAGLAGPRKRIVELRQWGKDVSKWVEMTVNFAKLLEKLVENRF